MKEYPNTYVGDLERGRDYLSPQEVQKLPPKIRNAIKKVAQLGECVPAAKLCPPFYLREQYDGGNKKIVITVRWEDLDIADRQLFSQGKRERSLADRQIFIVPFLAYLQSRYPGHDIGGWSERSLGTPKHAPQLGSLLEFRFIKREK